MIEKILYWTPRAIGVLGLLFMLMFSFDVFDGNAPLGKKLLGFLIHNIPVIILGLVIAAAWFWELEGGILIIAAALIACFKFNSFTTNKASLIIFIPFIITGILFIVHHLVFIRKRE